MKKIIALMLALLMMASLTACGGNAATPAEDVRPVESSYSFMFWDVELEMGAPFDPGMLPEETVVEKVPSHTMVGTDNVYNYEVIELTTFNDGTGEVIYSLCMLDPNTPTTEGLHLGDSLEQLEALYGTDYTANGTELVFRKGNALLICIVEDEVIISIEYRMVTE